MTPVFQTIFNDQEGNCLQAALASVLEVPLGDVPHFCLIPDETWWTALNAWMQERHGLAVICVVTGWEVPQVYHLITGDTPGGVEHATVGFAGEIVHDPHPRAFSELRNRKWWFFIPLDPAVARTSRRSVA